MTLKYAWWPGCVAKGAAPELYLSMKRVAAEMDIELVELDQATCTGAGVIQEQNPEMADALNARTFALAQQMGLPLMNICSTCQGIESMVQDKLSKRPEYLEKVNAILADEGLKYTPGLEIKNFLWVLVEDIGLDKLKSMVKVPTQVSASGRAGSYSGVSWAARRWTSILGSGACLKPSITTMSRSRKYRRTRASGSASPAGFSNNTRWLGASIRVRSAPPSWKWRQVSLPSWSTRAG